ncbi:Bug family tripartite tricarboxylate transporter substrate binding protein [Humitalea sp. 24SJ18S-53]|uniref:Bug family tripartite tricarboxylate transporter substrate binding protein n=1 Tax=Humitalea sp. 24SJ18S-53 TaxID=3422307 RepID=UPI003D664861
MPSTRRGVIAASLLGLSAPAFAQTYPSRPIRIVVGFAPGGAVDTLARLIAQKMGERFGAQAFIENRAGANSSIAAENVARSAPDGYSLLMITTSHVLNAVTPTRAGFDPVASFEPITEIAIVPNVVLVHPSLGVSTLQDFIALAKASPGKYNFASTGVGGATHLAGEAFKQAAGVDITHIPYQGAGPALNALIAGEVDAYFGSVSGAKAFVTSGRVRALAVPSRTRSIAMPEVPTTDEAGLPAFLFDTWYGMLAPARTPRPVVDTLLGQFREIMNLPDVRQRLAAEGAEPVLNSPEAFRAFMEEEIARLRILARHANPEAN